MLKIRMQKRTRMSLLFLLPALLLVGIFFLYPLVRVFIMSLQHWQVLGDNEFIGLENYGRVFTESEFWKTLWNTVIYAAIVTPMIFIPAIALANALKKTCTSSKIFRTLFFLPVAVSFVAASFIWKWIYNDTSGILNYVLFSIKFINQPVSWLGDTWISRIMVSVMVAWKTQGMTMIILIAGLQAIPGSLYESAKIDGASKRQEFFYITLPLLRPTIVLALIMSIAGSFKAFDHFFIMTGGGPMKTTETIVMYINKLAFEYFDVGFGAAVSVVFLILLLIISYFQMRLGGYKDE